MMKKMILGALIIGTIFQSSFYGNAAEPKFKFKVNGRTLSFSRELFTDNERVLIPVKEYFDYIGGDVSWDPYTKEINMSYKGKSAKMRVGSRYLETDEKEIKMDARPLTSREAVMVPVRYIADVFSTPIKYSARTKTIDVQTAKVEKSVSRNLDERNPKVVIDPGHGGNESGAYYGGIFEKDLNLKVANILYKKLSDSGIDVSMTRYDDTYVDLYDRTTYANSLRASIFLSIHHNAGFSRTKGTMTLFSPSKLSIKNFDSLDFANIVQDQLLKGLGTRDLGIIERPHLAVLRTANMPSVLAEIGYMSNSNELEKITDADFQEKAAESLKISVMKALGK